MHHLKDKWTNVRKKTLGIIYELLSQYEEIWKPIVKKWWVMDKNGCNFRFQLTKHESAGEMMQMALDLCYML